MNQPQENSTHYAILVLYIILFIIEHPDFCNIAWFKPLLAIYLA